MSLSTGELSSLGGSTLMMTATATSKTVSVLKERFPEIRKWTNITTSPARDNVTLVVPPPRILPSNLENMLEPFMLLSRDEGKSLLILVRGEQHFNNIG